MLSMLYRMFLLHIQAQTVPTENSSNKLKCSTLSKGCFSYNPGWNGACGELLQQTHAQYSS